MRGCWNSGGHSSTTQPPYSQTDESCSGNPSSTPPRDVESTEFFLGFNTDPMTQADIQQGRLVCAVGVAPVRPAEFVQFRIARYTADVPR